MCLNVQYGKARKHGECGLENCAETKDVFGYGT
jgi:hypothetical protein